MFISYITKNGPAFEAHATAQDAVRYVLDTLGPDYTKGPTAAFWASEDGARLRCDRRRMLDFAANIYDVPEAAIRAVAGYDDDALPPTLRALADAIERGIAQGFE